MSETHNATSTSTEPSASRTERPPSPTGTAPAEEAPAGRGARYGATLAAALGPIAAAIASVLTVVTDLIDYGFEWSTLSVSAQRVTILFTLGAGVAVVGAVAGAAVGAALATTGRSSQGRWFWVAGGLLVPMTVGLLTALGGGSSLGPILGWTALTAAIVVPPAWFLGILFERAVASDHGSSLLRLGTGFGSVRPNGRRRRPSTATTP